MKEGGNMVNKVNLSVFKDKSYIKRDTLIQVIKEQTNYNKDSSIRWVIYQLVKEGTITKVDNHFFYKGFLRKYKQKNMSTIKRRISDLLKKNYPDIDAVIYESTILNEWLNHQITQNVIFVEVEKYFMGPIFEYLKNELNIPILINPSVGDYYRYVVDNIIIVTQLITQTPKTKHGYDIKIEKLIVDLYANNLLKEFVSEDEHSNILQSMYQTYVVNNKTILAYAKRRNLENVVKEDVAEYRSKEGDKLD